MLVVIVLCWPELGCNIRVRSLGPGSAEWRLYLSLSHNNPESAPARHCHLLSPVRVESPHTTESNKSRQVTASRVYKDQLCTATRPLLIAAAPAPRSQQRWQLFSKCHVSERHSSCLSSTFKSSRNRFCFWVLRTTATSSCSSLLSACYKDVYPALERESTRRFARMSEINQLRLKYFYFAEF